MKIRRLIESGQLVGEARCGESGEIIMRRADGFVAVYLPDGSFMEGNFTAAGPVYDGSLFVEIRGRWRCVRTDGAVLHDFGPMNARPFLSVLAFERAGLWGLMAKDGRVVVEPEYIEILQPYHEYHGPDEPVLRLETPDHKFFLADNLGNIVCGPFLSEVLPLEVGSRDTLNHLIELSFGDENTSVFNCRTNNLLYDPAYRGRFGTIENISNGIVVDVDGFARLIDLEGNIIISESEGFAELGMPPLEGEYLIPARYPKKSWGYINENGIVKIPMQYYYAKAFRNGEAEVGIARHDNISIDCVVIDRHGNILRKLENVKRDWIDL